MDARQLGGNFIFALHRLDAVEFGFDGADALGILGWLIHAGFVIVTDLLLHGRAAWIILRRGFQNRFQYALIPELEFAIRPPEGLIGRDRIGGNPLLAGVLIEVHARINAVINLIQIEVVNRREFRSLLRMSQRESQQSHSYYKL